MEVPVLGIPSYVVATIVTTSRVRLPIHIVDRADTTVHCYLRRNLASSSRRGFPIRFMSSTLAVELRELGRSFLKAMIFESQLLDLFLYCVVIM